MALPNVGFVRPEISRLIPLYYLIRDCIEGEFKVKSLGDKYLPRPNAADVSKENCARYAAYVQRAVFYNVTRRTLSGLCGQVFMRDPIVKLPTLLQPMIADATGAGVSLDQCAKQSVQMTLAYSRSGLFADYPATSEEGATVEQMALGNIRPTFSTYSPLEIINWRVIEVGARELLSLVVLAEMFCVEDDGFEMKHGGQYRVLRLDDAGNYTQEIWRELSPTAYDQRKMTNGKNGNFQMHSTLMPTGADGLPLKEIPFTFIGSDNNDPSPDNPNMEDLASINIAHYRNSADYEEACFIVGQPTAVVTGLTAEWLKEQLGGVVAFGSRGGIPLPEGADAKLLQAESNTMLKEAMEAKERQMVALGAKLVEQKQVQRTAFETKVETTSEGSVLSQTTKNVATAYLWALKWAARMVGQPDTGVEFELNTDFDISASTPEAQAQALKTWQSGGITFKEYRNTLREAGLATEDDDAAKASIDSDTADAMALAMPDNVPGDGSAPPVPPAKKSATKKAATPAKAA